MIELITGLVAVVVGLFIKGSFQKSKIKDLKEENQAAETIINIKNEMKEAENNAEHEEVMAKAHIDSSNWRNEI